MGRDNFTQKVKNDLAQQVSNICSNPGCRVMTVANGTSIGVAAHITAASENGPRYNKNLSSEERKSGENGIWLCQTCSVLIDKEPQKYSEEVLRSWKKENCEYARSLLGKKVDTNKVIFSPEIRFCLDYFNIENDFMVRKEINRQHISELIKQYYESNSPKITPFFPKLEDIKKQFELSEAEDTVIKKNKIVEIEKAVQRQTEKVSFLLQLIFDDHFSAYYTSFTGSELSSETLTDLLYFSINYVLGFYSVCDNSKIKVDIFYTDKSMCTSFDFCESEILDLLSWQGIERENILLLRYKDLKGIPDGNYLLIKILSVICVLVSKNIEKYRDDIWKLFFRELWHIGLS